MARKAESSIVVEKEGKFYIGFCVEIPQARGQGKTKAEAVRDTERAIRLAGAYLRSR